MDKLYEEYNGYTNEQLIEKIAKDISPVTASSSASRNRDLAKAILNSRWSKITARHNVIMAWLTGVILFFTIVVAVLTALLVYKEFFR